jgi:hypothetical protein
MILYSILLSKDPPLCSLARAVMRCSKNVTMVLEWYYSGATAAFQQCYSRVTVMLHECYLIKFVTLEGPPVMFPSQWCYAMFQLGRLVIQCYCGGTMVLQWWHSGVTVVL